MKVLIIGFGSIGRRHTEILSSFPIVDEIHIVSKQNNLDFISYKTLEEVEDLNQFDYFVIASITSLHVPQLRYINNCVLNKIILVEKPLGLEPFEFNSKNHIFVAYNLRFHPVISKIKEMLSNETVLNVNVQAGQYLPTWRPDRDYSETYSASVEKGGGVLLDLSHEIDYLFWLFGDIKFFSSINDKISDLEIKTDDFVTAIGRMKSGAIFNFSMDYISKIPLRLIIINTVSKTIKVDLINNVFTYSDKTCQLKNISLPVTEKNSTYEEMHKQLLGMSEDHNAATFDDGLKVLSIVQKIRMDSYGK